MSQSTKLLAGRIALVTGGGTGIGASIAKMAAVHGAKVVVTGPILEDLQKTVAAIQQGDGQAWAYVHDVSDKSSCDDLAKRVKADVGDVSVLVNNAGIIRYATMDTPEVDAAWADILGVNLTGPFQMVRSFLEPLKATKGAVVNLASIAGFIYTNNTAAYSASKGGVRGLTFALARELGPLGIRVNAVAPGSINTTMSPSSSDAQKREVMLKRVPLGRIGEPEDIANAAVFLASGMAAYITGTTLVVDGGFLTN